MTVEFERYELIEGARYRFDLDRRDFLRSAGAGLLVLLGGASRRDAGIRARARRPRTAAG